MRLDVSTVTDVAALHLLRHDWERLADLDSTRSAYRGWTSQVHHYLMRADGSIPHVAVLRNRAEKVVGILPTAIGTTRHGPIRLRILRPLAQQTWPDFAPLVEPELAGEAAEALREWIERSGQQVDRVDLRFLRSADGPLTPRGGPLSLTPTAVPTFRTVFPDGAQQWPELLGAHARKSLRNKHRRLTTELGVGIARLVDPDAIQRWLPAFQALHTDRARHLGRDLLFEIGTTARDFGAMLAEMVQLDQAEFHVLTTGDRLIAGQITFRAGDTTHDYRRTFDGEFARYGPGGVLQTAAMQRSLDRGDRQFDFGLGASDHKRRWATDTDPTFRLEHARGIRHAALACYTRLARARNRLRSVRGARATVEMPT